jgi:hypothetical protein
MITDRTAEAIIAHNRKLEAAERCLKNIKDCGAIEVIIRRDHGDARSDTPDEFNIGSEYFGRILRDIIARQRARLDELNTLAVQEAQDVPQR